MDNLCTEKKKEYCLYVGDGYSQTSFKSKDLANSFITDVDFNSGTGLDEDLSSTGSR